MAEGFIKSYNPDFEVFSAGTEPSGQVHPKAIQAMQEIGIDISKNYPKSVSLFLNDSFNYVISVCGGARESCPMFSGDVEHILHIGFDDPADARGSNEEIMNEFRRIRDEIKRDFDKFYKKISH